ncbi:MAG: F0F1 ATP synthase subunit delta [Firmicutes bacterium]|nr:F0F1 ATP synthase subunit delta [Bacillota bacterium]
MAEKITDKIKAEQKTHIRIIASSHIEEDSAKKIESFLQKKHPNDKQLAFEYEVDNSILGGILIVDGDKYYDGTLKSQLIKIRKSLDTN